MAAVEMSWWRGAGLAVREMGDGDGGVGGEVYAGAGEMDAAVVDEVLPPLGPPFPFFFFPVLLPSLV